MVYQELHHSVQNSFPELVKLNKLQFLKFLAWFRGVRVQGLVKESQNFEMGTIKI